jgi:hypothetical protein
VLNGKNIWANHHCKKLEDKIYEPFKVLSSGITGTYSTLTLLESWKIYLTFNVALLLTYRGSDTKKWINEVEEDNADWKMEYIIACGVSDGDLKKYVFSFMWERYSHDENA